MELTLIATHFSDILWIVMALFAGLLVSLFSLPPMVGYLLAGFVLSGLGLESGETLMAVAELGITFLLFSIGLKLNIRDLLKTEIWAVSVIHMLVVIVLFGSVIFWLGFSSIQLFTGLTVLDSAVIAFALSFSSTVFAVKVLDEMGEASSLHGKIAIGILIMQDLFAVLFLAAAAGKVPSYWAVLLLLLLPLRPLLIKLVRKASHGEMLVLTGLTLALGGAMVFDAVGVKADLGALALGVLLSGTDRSEKLAKSLLAFKDVFLVAFFLSIGFYGHPDLTLLLVALGLAVVMLFKSFLFFYLLTHFKLRARTSFLTSLSLANYSEFGLIVGAIGVSVGWMDRQWLVVIAIALSLTFVFAALVNAHAHRIYARFEQQLCRFESGQRLPGDTPIESGDAEVLVFGMGRVGTGVYDTLLQSYGENLLGIDYDESVVAAHLAAGRNAIVGDATDYDFWARLRPDSVRLIMLDMPNLKELLAAVTMIKNTDYTGVIAAAVKHDDCIASLKQAGVDSVFNVYAEAGSGFAHHVCEEIKSSPT